jgi:hypothetical protein
MVNRITLYAAAFASSLSLSAVALAANAPGSSISGPTNGTNVETSTAVQQRATESQREGRSVFYRPRVLPFGMWGAALTAGAPGVKGAPGVQSGR